MEIKNHYLFLNIDFKRNLEFKQNNKDRNLIDKPMFCLDNKINYN